MLLILCWPTVSTSVDSILGSNIAVQNATQNDDLHSRLKYVKQGFQFLNEIMGKDILELFEQSTVDWEGDPFDIFFPVVEEN